MIADLVKKYGISPEDAESLNAAMKVVCVNCAVEMKPSAVGVTLCETRSMLGSRGYNAPYLLWNADMLECPKCLRLVITRFAVKPFARSAYCQIHMDEIKNAGGRIYYCNEH